MAAPVDPPAPTPAEPATPSPTPQPGPWAADLAEYFGDNPEAIAAADRYMREKVQPGRTQFEMETAPARELFKDLVDKPEETLAEVVAELYGEERPDVVEKFAAIFAEGEPAEPKPPTGEPAEPSTLTPEQQRVLAWAEAKEQEERDAKAREEGEAEYQQTLAELREAHPDLTDADVELIHPFMSAAGDPETAYAGYQAFLTQFKATHGLTPAEAAAEPTPPPVLGGDAAPAAVPPTESKIKTFDDAWDAWQAEKAAVAPPVVGSV